MCIFDLPIYLNVDWISDIGDVIEIMIIDILGKTTE